MIFGGYMFRFVKEHSYEIFKFFLTQIGIAVFGLVLSFATNSNDLLFLLTSIFATVFYCCLLYSEAWEIGAKDRPRMLNGRMKFSVGRGFVYGCLSNSLNFFLTVVMIICLLFGSKIVFFGNVYVIFFYVQRTISAMFMGINEYFAPVNIINGIEYTKADSIFHPLFYLLSTIPSIASIGLGYFMGANDRKLFTVKKPD